MAIRSGGAGLVACLLGFSMFWACIGLDPPRDEGLPDVGEPCVALDESFAEFGGFSEREVNIEDGGSCGVVNVCLVHAFRGRATCPSGQSAGDEGCTTPGGEPVTVPVQAQLPGRPAEMAMVCSCRCNGPDPNADYCACPDGMRCEELIAVRANIGNDYAGSYCVY